MDESAVKALWLRGKSYEAIEDWDKSIDALQKACKLQPNDIEFRKGLDQVKAKKLKEFK